MQYHIASSNKQIFGAENAECLNLATNVFKCYNICSFPSVYITLVHFRPRLLRTASNSSLMDRVWNLPSLAFRYAIYIFTVLTYSV